MLNSELSNAKYVCKVSCIKNKTAIYFFMVKKQE